MRHVLRALSLCAIATALIGATQAPKPVVAVLRMSGTASETGKIYAGAAIVAALNARGYNATISDLPANDLPMLGASICASTGATLLLGGTLSIATEKNEGISPAWSAAAIALNGYDCVKDRDLGTQSGRAGGFAWQWAVDNAARAALKAYTRREL